MCTKLNLKTWPSVSRHVILFCFGLVLSIVNEANAGGLTIWPLHINLTSDRAAQEIQVSNPSSEATYVQVMAVEWHAPEDIGEASPIDEIIAVPPIFELDPNGNQLVRLAPRGQIQDGIEKSYRLVITEVPRTAGLVPNSLAIATRMTLPIFVTPDSASPIPIWTLDKRSTGKAALMLTNQGSAHIRVTSVELLPASGDQATFASEEGGLVLAGKDMSWPVDLDLTNLNSPVTVKAKTNIGMIETVLSLPES